MKALERYLLREFLVPFGYCVVAFLMIMVVYDLFDNLSTFIKWRLALTEVTGYYVATLPTSVVITLPISMLLAMLYGLATLSKHNELIAMRASGLSLQRLLAPYLAVGAAGSLVLFLLNETIVPRSIESTQRFMSDHKLAYQQTKAAQPETDPQRAAKLARARATSLFFYNAKDRRHWMIQEFDLGKRVITNGVEVLQRDEAGRDQWKAVAAWGKFLDGRWWFFDVKIFDLSGETPRVIDNSRQRPMDEITETPRHLAAQLKKPEQMTVKELKSYLRMHRELPSAKLAPFQVNLHQRYAQPWMCLVMVLLAVSMGGRVGRKGPLVSVASTLALFFAYWFVLQVALRMGEAAYLSPVLAAWAANLLFGLIGLIGYFTLK
jgi:lipopolysaccharide export system permease protein